MSLRIALETQVYRIFMKLWQGSEEKYSLPTEHEDFLSSKNPILKDLKSRYYAAAPTQQSLWTYYENAIDLQKFRGEGYLAQGFFRNTLLKYQITAAYVQAVDNENWLGKLKEDSAFGVKLWEVANDVRYSRDILDSILEILFLRDHLGWKSDSQFRVLDIGAGYGRFAHRLTSLYKNCSAASTDAVATSTFLCDFYLKYRQADRASVIPFDKLSNIKVGEFDLATNIHSWSECPKEFIGFWLDRLVDFRVPYLFIVPHDGKMTSKETDGRRISYYDEIIKRGYTPMIHRPKFSQSSVAQSLGVFPTEYWLFKRG